jgi:hypothetical protein
VLQVGHQEIQRRLETTGVEIEPVGSCVPSGSGTLLNEASPAVSPCCPIIAICSSRACLGKNSLTSSEPKAGFRFCFLFQGAAASGTASSIVRSTATSVWQRMSGTHSALVCLGCLEYLLRPTHIIV